MERIAFIGHKRIQEREGGVEIVVSELVTRLVKKGYKVDVYNRKGRNVQDNNSKMNNIKEYNGARVYNIPTINKKGLEAFIYSIFASIRIAFGKYDIVHYHAEGCCGMLWFPKLFRKRIIVTIHGLDWQRAKWGSLASRYIKFGEKMAVKYADEIIVLSENVKKYFKEEYNIEPHFIPNGVNKPIMRNAHVIKEKYNLDKDGYILFLSRIVPEKGLDYLINAYNQVVTNKKLVIAGGASNTKDYYNYIVDKCKGNRNIIMTGFVNGTELYELYSNCYLYVLPSDIEGMPLSLLEAMSYGKNCLISNIEENLQVVGDYATCFEKSNVKDLKLKLEECLSGEKRLPDMIISNYVLSKYNWDDVADKTEKVYKRGNYV